MQETVCGGRVSRCPLDHDPIAGVGVIGNGLRLTRETSLRPRCPFGSPYLLDRKADPDDGHVCIGITRLSVVRQRIVHPQQIFDWRFLAVDAVKDVLAEQLSNDVSTSFEFNYAASLDVVEVLSCATDQQRLSVNDASDKWSLGQINPPCGDRFEGIWSSLHRRCAAPTSKRCRQQTEDNQNVAVQAQLRDDLTGWAGTTWSPASCRFYGLGGVPNETNSSYTPIDRWIAA